MAHLAVPSISSLVEAKTLLLNVFVNSTLDTDKTVELHVGTVYVYPRGEVYLVAVFSFVVGFIDVLISHVAFSVFIQLVRAIEGIVFGVGYLVVHLRRNLHGPEEWHEALRGELVQLVLIH